MIYRLTIIATQSFIIFCFSGTLIAQTEENKGNGTEATKDQEPPEHVSNITKQDQEAKGAMENENQPVLVKPEQAKKKINNNPTKSEPAAEPATQIPLPAHPSNKSSSTENSADNHTSNLSESNNESNPFIRSTLPWLLTGTSLGALLVLSLFVYRKGQKNKTLIKKIKDGSEPVTLLTEEAVTLLHQVANLHNEAFRKQDEERSQNYASLVESQQRHEATLQHFKDKHNDAMKAIAGKINEILNSSHQHVSKTQEHLKTLTPLLSERADEIQKYKEGHFHQLLSPLLSTFFDIRDDIKDKLYKESEHLSPDTVETLNSYESEISEALQEIGLDEIPIKQGDKLEANDHRLWQDTGAARSTDDATLHKTCARVVKIGYILRSPNDAPDYVIRKTTVEQYSSHIAQSDDNTPNTEVASTPVQSSEETTPSEKS